MWREGSALRQTSPKGPKLLVFLLAHESEQGQLCVDWLAKSAGLILIITPRNRTDLFLLLYFILQIGKLRHSHNGITKISNPDP